MKENPINLKDIREGYIGETVGKEGNRVMI